MSTRLSTVNLVIGGLVLITLALLALVGIIAVNDDPGAVPEALWTLLGGAIGALASMLARTSTSDEAPAAEPVDGRSTPSVPPAPPTVEPLDHSA